MTKEIDDWCEEIAKVVDEKAVEFLNANGYPIEKPYTREKALQIAKQLKNDGKKLVHDVLADKFVRNDDGSVSVIGSMHFWFERLSEKDE